MSGRLADWTRQAWGGGNRDWRSWAPPGLLLIPCHLVLSSCLPVLFSSCPLLVLFLSSSGPLLVLVLSSSCPGPLLLFLPPVLLSSCPPVLLSSLSSLSSCPPCPPVFLPSSALLRFSYGPLLLFSSSLCCHLCSPLSPLSATTGSNIALQVCFSGGVGGQLDCIHTL